MCDNATLQVFDNVTAAPEGESQAFRVSATGATPLTFTLSWMDLPQEPGNYPLLRNDLDLVVSHFVIDCSE